MIKAGDYEALKNHLESRTALQLKELEQVGSNGLRDIDSLLFYSMNYKSERMVDILTLLLNFGADPNVTNQNGTTLLMSAAEANNEEAIKVLLNSKDIDLKKLDATGFSMATHYAVRANAVQAFQALIDAGMDAHYVCPLHGKNYLHIAAAEGNTEMCDLLISLKVDPTLEESIDNSLASELVPSDESFAPLFDKIEEYRNSVKQHSTGFELD